MRTLTSSTAVLIQLNLTSVDDRRSLHLQLPEFDVNGLLPVVLDVDQAHISFVLLDKIQALRHVSCLLRVLVDAAVPRKKLAQRNTSFDKHLPWLIDSLEALNEEQKRWNNLSAYAPVSILEQALNLVTAVPGIDHILTQKLDAIIVLIAVDVAQQTNETQDGAQRPNPASKTLALALIYLANASIKKRPIAKLVAAQLLKNLNRLIIDGRAQDGGDLKVRSLMNY